MSQEIEYAEMLEIPVSTVNVIHKKRRKKETANRDNPPQTNTNFHLPTPMQTQNAMPLKDTVIAQVNERVGEETANNENAQASFMSLAVSSSVYSAVKEIVRFLLGCSASPNTSL